MGWGSRRNEGVIKGQLKGGKRHKDIDTFWKVKDIAIMASKWNRREEHLWERLSNGTGSSK